MANTVDENLKIFLQGDSAVTKHVGVRIHENYVPQSPMAPYIWFRLVGTDQERTLGDSAPNTPYRYRFDLEIWTREIRCCRTIAEAVFQRLDSYRGTFGDSTVKGIFVENMPDEYDALGGDSGLHFAALQVEVIP